MSLIVGGDRNASNKSLWLIGETVNDLVWSYDTGARVRGVLQDAAGNIWAVGDAADNGDGNGTRSLWKLAPNGSYLNGANITGVSANTAISLSDEDGRIYCGVAEGTFLNIGAQILTDFSTITGFIAASGTTGNAILVATVDDNHIYVGSGGASSVLTKIDNDDLTSTLWSKNPGSTTCKGLVELSTGVIVAAYVRGVTPWLRAYNSDGSVAWTFNSYAGAGDLDVVVDANCVTKDSSDNVYYAGGGYVVKLNSSGVLQWRTDQLNISASFNAITVSASGKIFVGGARISNYTIWEVASDGSAFTQIYDTGATVRGLMGETTIAPITPALKQYSKKLVVVGNGQLWYESAAGTMSHLSGSALDPYSITSIFEAYQKVFVANKTNLKVADFGNVKLATSDLGANPPDHGNVLTGGTSGAEMVVDYITNLDDDEACTIYGQRITSATFSSGETVTGKDDDNNDVSFSLNADEVAGPHWYNWTAYGDAANETTSVYGKLPTQATIGCLYRGRAVLAGDTRYPHQWYMSRQGHPWDWVYGINDAQSAVAGNDADAGEIGDIITALIPYQDDYLIFGCTNTVWYLAGDPCSGGEINEFDLTTGIYGPQSWCFGSGETLYFWGTNGLYKTTIPGTPECISEIQLPGLVNDEGADPSSYSIVLSYDRRRIGILVCITKLVDGSNSNYWYDLRTGGFFPETYPEECGVFSAFFYEAENFDYRTLIVGCYDGYLRFFDDSAKDDDIGDTDEAINAYVTFGPVPMAQDPKFTGKLTGLDCVSAGGAASGSQSDSDDIDYEVYVGNSAEEVIEKLSAGTNPNIAGTIQAPGRRRGSIIHRKVKGVYIGIKLKNDTAAEAWAFEQLLYDLKIAGRLK